MTTFSSKEISQLLVAWSEGDKEALEKLTPLVYQELHRLARRYMRRESPAHTLQTSALVNEAYIKLVDQRKVRWQNRAHFFGVAAQLMRRILVDHARAHARAKRGGNAQRLSIDDAAIVTQQQAAELIALDEALTAFAEIDPHKSRIVEMKFFGGLTTEEAAEVMGVSPRTIEREWRKARAWLHHAISKGVSIKE